MLMLFTLISLYNYCVEITSGNCAKCSNLPEGTITIDHLPTISENNNLADTNVYLSESIDVPTMDDYVSYKTFTVCGDSVEFIYSSPINKILMFSSHLELKNEDTSLSVHPLPAPVSVNFAENITLLFNSFSTQQIIFKSTQQDLFILPENCITNEKSEKIFSISEDSQPINIFDIDDCIKSIFKDTSTLKEVQKSYFCISDQEDKCKDFAEYNPQIIDSVSEITGQYSFLIVETKTHLIYSSDYHDRYIKFYGYPGSHIFYDCVCNSHSTSNGDFHIIVRDGEISMTNSKYTGEGSFILRISTSSSIWSETSQGDIDFMLLTNGFSEQDPLLYPLFSGQSCSLTKKIKVSESTIFYGEEGLSGLFDKNYYIQKPSYEIINQDEINVPQVDGIQYSFSDGTFEIPSHWNKKSTFYGNPNTILTFKNVHSLSYSTIDEIIEYPNVNLIIYQADYFGLKCNLDGKNIEFVIEDDVIFDDLTASSSPLRMTKENTNCNFKGTGTVKFRQSQLKSQLEGICTKEEGVTFADYESPTLPDYYVCVGQTSLDDCKNEIDEVESITGVSWIWITNILTLSQLKNVKRVYITDKQNEENIYNMDEYEVILTKNADYSIYSTSITINQNKVEHVTSQASTAKLTCFVRARTNIRKLDLNIKFNAKPTGLNFMIYVDAPLVNLFVGFLDNEYEVGSINIDGSSTFFVRDVLRQKLDVFNYMENSNFIITVNTDSNVECLCFTESLDKCFTIDDDFKQIQSLNEITPYDDFTEEDFEDDDYLHVYVFDPLSLSMNMPFSMMVHLDFMKGSSVNFDVPDKSRILFYLSADFCGFEIINQNLRSVMFYVLDETVEVVFNVKNTVYLDAKFESQTDKTCFIPKIKFESKSNSIEIIPSIEFSSIIHDNYDPNYKFTVSNDLSITSIMPEYLNSLFESETITFSGTCVYLNDEGKTLCGTKPSKSFTEAQAGDIDTKNIVITTGIDETFSIPSSWKNEHCLYFVKTESSKISLKDSISTLTYYSDGLKISENNIIIAGTVTILVPTEVTYNIDLPKGVPIYSYMYLVYLDCSSNQNTILNSGKLISVNQVINVEALCFNIIGYDESHTMTLNFISQKTYSKIQNFINLDGDSSYLSMTFGDYDYICYASSDEAEEKCTEAKYYLASDVSSVLKAAEDFPDLEILVTKDLSIPESFNKLLYLKASEESIVVSLPLSPISIKIEENNEVTIYYADSKQIKTLNKMNISVDLNYDLEMNVYAVLESHITFNLYFDVLLSTQAKITHKFTILVNYNDYHLYTLSHDFGFSLIFGLYALEIYSKVCVYEENAESLCTYDIQKPIENIFPVPVKYHEIEAVIITSTQEVSLPSTYWNIRVLLKPESSSVLTVNSIFVVQMKSANIILNNYWYFIKNMQNLRLKIINKVTFSITEVLSTPITFKLNFVNLTVIDLKECVLQDKKLLTFEKFGDEENIVTVLSTPEAFNNFKSLLASHDNIKFVQQTARKYLCICKDDTCNKCKEGIEGTITNSDKFNSDPGEDVEIRVFLNTEVEPNLFTNEHNVFIDSSSTLTINNVENVYQNIENKLKVGKLLFSNGNNLIIKPKTSELGITMSKQKAGPEFTIQLSGNLILKVLNANEEGIVASKLHVKGSGELNLYDYPFDKVEAESTVKVIKGIYIICNSKAEDSICSFESLDNYKVINIFDTFENKLDSNTKIYVFLNTYSSRIDADINQLNHQQIIFVNQKETSSKLLENDAKVRFLSTSVLTNTADAKTNLDGSEGGVSLLNEHSDHFIVAFDDKLRIKQEGEITSPLKPVVVQPQNDKASIIIDNNVKVDKQQIQIDTEKENLELTVYVGNKPADDDATKNFIQKPIDKDVNIVFVEGNHPDDAPPEEPEKPKKGLKPGEIAGIVIGVVAFVAIVIAVVIVVIKKKNKKENSSTEVSDNV